MRKLCLVLLMAACAFGQQSSRPGLYRAAVYVPLGAVPTVLTTAFNVPTDVYMVVLTNTNSSTQATVTVNCGGTPFIQALINGVSTQSNHVVVPYPDGLSCSSVTWISSVSGVNGTMTGKQ